jgi:hypothetical protein
MCVCMCVCVHMRAPTPFLQSCGVLHKIKAFIHVYLLIIISSPSFLPLSCFSFASLSSWFIYHIADLPA